MHSYLDVKQMPVALPFTFRNVRWLENLLLRVQHPVQAFLNKAETSTGTLDKSTAKVFKKLNTLEESTIAAKEKIREFFDGQR